MAQGYVLLHRSSVESEFFQDEWLCKLWMWCLCRANYKDQEWKGETIAAGSFVTGRHAAADALRVTESKFYRGLKRLENMQMIVTKSNNRFTIVTLCNWDIYQNVQSANRTTDEQPANSQRTTNEQPANTIKERKQERNIYGAFRKPSIEEVSAYCQLRKNTIDPEAFIAHYESKGWMIGKNRMKDWKAAIVTWEKNNRQQAKPTEKGAETCQPMSRKQLDEWRPLL